MQIIENTTEFKLNKRSAVAIGKFDGIHVGHQKIINAILEQRKNKMQSVIFTFEPSPLSFFTGKDWPELTTKEEKRLLFQDMGIDVLIEFPLNKETSSISPDGFIRDVLVNRMNMSFVAAGMDVSFGDKGKGNYKTLKKYAGQFDYKVEIVDKICDNGMEISSTMIRDKVNKGEMKEVQRLMGEAYSVTGIVAYGHRIGRRLGMPTVNLLPPKTKLLPPFGVYYSEVQYGDNIYRGITNIGCKPTVGNHEQIGIETYLYDFAQDIYGKKITVRLFEFKRPEMKFQSMEELKAQMERDILEGRYYSAPDRGGMAKHG